MLVDDLEHCAVRRRHLRRARRSSDALFAARTQVAPVGLDSVKARDGHRGRLPRAGDGRRLPVIGVAPGRIITERRDARSAVARTAPSAVDLGATSLKVAVVERHGKNGNIGRGFVTGFGLKRGAIASSVGHDSHNICVDRRRRRATWRSRSTASRDAGWLRRGRRRRGAGRARAADCRADGCEPFEAVREALIPLRAAARDLGCTLAEPFLQVAFLPLPVIPHLKITDFGLFDVDRFELVAA